MAFNNDDYRRLSQYLLGQLTPDDQQEIEKRLLTDDDFFEHVQAAEDELIDDYLAGDLSTAEADSFHSHFLVTSEREQKFQFARAFRRYASQSSKLMPAVAVHPKASWTASFFSSPLKMLAVAAVVLVAAMGVWRVFFQQSDVDKGLLALNEAYKKQRPLEARISQLDYAPYSVTRGEPGQVDSLARDRAERILMDAVAADPGPSSYSAFGKFLLAQRDFDRAIEQFERARQAAPNDAQVYADLGAGWLEKAKSEQPGQTESGGVTGFSRALENLNKSLALDSSQPAPLFNRAITYEYLHLPSQAEADWNEYLKRDPSSPWAEEARRRLDQLQQQQKNKSGKAEDLKPERFLEAYQKKDDNKAWQIVSQNRDAHGGPILNKLVDEYLDHASNGRQEAALETLDVLFYVARLEKERAGDLFVADLTGFLKSLTALQRTSLIEARNLVKLGISNIRQGRLETAVENLTKAKELFEQLGEPAQAAHVNYPLGHAYLNQLKSQPAADAFEAAVREGESRQYKWLVAQALNGAAIAQMALANYSAAIELSKRSIELSSQIGDTTGVIKTTSQMAHQDFLLGNYSKSLVLHEQALRLAETTPTELRQVYRNYFHIPMPLNALGLHSAAIEYQKEALKVAEELKEPTGLRRSYSILGVMYAGRGDRDEAVANGNAALELANQITDPQSQKDAVAYASLQLGRIHAQLGDYPQAAEAYDKSIQLYGELGDYQAFSYVAHKGKLLACRKQPSCPYLDEEIRICLDLFERFRDSIREQSNRIPFFDTEEDVYDVAIAHEFSKGNAEKAFEYSERSRARSLFDLAHGKGKVSGDAQNPDIVFDVSQKPQSFAEIVTALPEQAQVVQYSVLPDKLLIWLVSKNGAPVATSSISRDELNAKLTAYLKLISAPHNDDSQLIAQGAELYDFLIKPIEPSLKKEKLLCIVPDKALNYLPFGALVSSQTRRFLVSEYRLSFAPSTAMFANASSELAKKTRNADETLLAVGNPRFSHEQFPALPDLPSAVREAREVKAYYESSRALTGEMATKEAVKAEMIRADVVHLALHSIADESAPMRSKLVLADGQVKHGGAETNGVLTDYEIYGSRLPNTYLVVLSACQTGVGRYYRGEGVMGLSRAFMATGVPLVVASLWRVDSDSTANLMIAFHRHRRVDQLSSAAALQRAQQEMLDGPDKQYRHPYYWAAFTIVGGYATV